MKPGYTRQGLQVPSSMGLAFRHEMGRLKLGGVKDAGTLMMGVYLGMPAELRKSLHKWLWERDWEMEDGAEPVTPEEVWSKIVELSTATPQPETRRKK